MLPRRHPTSVPRHGDPTRPHGSAARRAWAAPGGPAAAPTAGAPFAGEPRAGEPRAGAPLVGGPPVGPSLAGLPSAPWRTAHAGHHTVPLVDAAAAGAGDRAAVAAGETWGGLMHRAAGHLARGVIGLAGYGYGLRVALLVGKGNNGGDGWAAARRLEHEHGARCWVVAVDGVEVAVSEEAGANRAAWTAGGGRTTAGLDDLEAALAWCDVAVDCLLGTGVSGAPRGAVGEAASALNAARAGGTPVVACDVPSGVSSDDGAAPEGSVRADLTVTLGAVKRGLLLHPGAAHVGRLVLGELGARYEPGASAWSALTPDGAAPPRYTADTDKRARGVVLAVAGGAGTTGAAALTATGALRTGAGLVSLATPDDVAAEVAARCDPGVMVRGLAFSSAASGSAGPVGDAASDPAGSAGNAASGSAGPADGDELDGLVARSDVVVAGPGLGPGPATAEVTARLRATARRLVLDADALNVHRDAPDELADHAGTLVLTPHERELARIGGGADGPEAFAERVARVPHLAARYDATIVAKGPGTLIAAPDGRVWVTPVGGPSSGSGGTGDVLAGVIAAAIATADDVPAAVARAVWWHAAAGELAGAHRAGRATASDLLAALGEVLGGLDAGRHV